MSYMRNRSKFRFGLATMLVAFAIASIPLAMVRHEQQRRAKLESRIFALREHGVLFITGGPLKHPVYGRLQGGKLETVHRLVIDGEMGTGDLSGEHLDLLLHLENVQLVHISNSNITDEGLMKLAKLPKLKLVRIWDSPSITDEGVRRFNEARPDATARKVRILP